MRVLAAWFGIALVTLPVAALAAQEPGTVRGRLLAAGEPMSMAEVELSSRHRATVGSDGRFRFIGIPDGPWRLRVRALGFVPLTREIVLPRDSMLGDLILTPRTIELEEFVVTGTLAEVRLADSPVKVEVISRTALERNLTTNLMESIRALPGLREQVDCGVCYTNSISINGMEGAYTAVLFDGVPMLGALATVYALNSLNPALIEQVEVVRGPASTLYGSEAMGGVVNVITRDPRTAPAWSVTTNGSTHGEFTTDAMARPAFGGGRLLAAASITRDRRFIDGNTDGFSDRPLVSRYTGFLKWSNGRASERTVDLQARYWYEDRFGGVRGWTPAERGGDQYYGESIYTTRWEAIAGLRPTLLGVPLRVDLALSDHQHDSFYGTQQYLASQQTAFAQAAWAPSGSGQRLRPLLGATVRRQRYDDNTPATSSAEDRVVPGVFGELDVRASDRLSLLGGLRIDRQSVHGLIPSPRLAIRWQPGYLTTVRLNLATGFRVVNLFTEDHAALSGSRRVEITEALKPERSVTATASVNTLVGIGDIPVTVDADLFVTRFSNRITPDYASDPDLIVYRNLRGKSLTRGVSLAASASPLSLPITMRLAGTWQRVTRTDEGVTTPIAFSPQFKGDFTLSWTAPGAMSVDWTGSVTGPMALPRIADLPVRSPWFTEQHLQATRAIQENAFLTIGVKNLFDIRQQHPLVAPDDPFGPSFDTNRVWGPVQGRRFFLAIQWNGEP